jgi:hypothetical protein
MFPSSKLKKMETNYVSYLIEIHPELWVYFDTKQFESMNQSELKNVLLSQPLLAPLFSKKFREIFDDPYDIQELLLKHPSLAMYFETKMFIGKREIVENLIEKYPSLKEYFGNLNEYGKDDELDNRSDLGRHSDSDNDIDLDFDIDTYNEW